MLQIRTCFFKCITKSINSHGILSKNKHHMMNLLAMQQKKKIRKPFLHFNAKLKVCKTLMDEMNER